MKFSDFMAIEDLAGWRITIVYHLELKHDQIGFFPAVINNSSQEIVICVERRVIGDVGKLLAPRPNKLVKRLALVNEELNICVFLSSFVECAKSEILQEENISFNLLTPELFNEIVISSPKPFKWAPGLFGPDITREEFIKTPEAATT